MYYIYTYFCPQHKGFCSATHTLSHNGEEYLESKCEIYEPEVKDQIILTGSIL